MSEIIDLDVLEPQHSIIKLNGKEISVPPPTVGNLLRLANLAKSMSEMDTETDDGIAQCTELFQKLDAHIKKCIPELEGQALGMLQVQRLVEILSGMATPPDTKELEAQGITADTPKVP